MEGMYGLCLVLSSTSTYVYDIAFSQSAISEYKHATIKVFPQVTIFLSNCKGFIP